MRQRLSGDALKVAMLTMERAKGEMQYLHDAIEEAMPPIGVGEGSPENQWRRGFFIGQTEALVAAMLILDVRIAIMRETGGAPLGATGDALFPTDTSAAHRGASRR